MAAGQLWDELRRRPAPGEAAGSGLLTRAEAAAGSRGAGVERGAATGARARGVAPGGHRALEQGGRAALADGFALAWRSLSPAVNRRGPDAPPVEPCAATRCDANKTRKQRLSQVFGALASSGTARTELSVQPGRARRAPDPIQSGPCDRARAPRQPEPRKAPCGSSWRCSPAHERK